MTCGIYKIENKESGKVYIGSSKNIEKRWEAHEVGRLLKLKQLGY